MKKLKLNVRALQEAKQNSEQEVAHALEVINLKEQEVLIQQQSFEQKSKAIQLDLEKIRQTQDERGLFTGPTGPYDYIPSLRNVSDDVYDNDILIFKLSKEISGICSSDAARLQLRGLPPVFCRFTSLLSVLRLKRTNLTC